MILILLKPAFKILLIPKRSQLIMSLLDLIIFKVQFGILQNKI